MKRKNIHNIKDTGFTVPKDYFNDFEDSILSHVKLNNLTNQTGFKVPEGYFENLEETILNQISEKDTPKVVPLFGKRSIIYISSIAAAILLLFNLSIFESSPNWDSLDAETVENYLINENIGSYEIASTLDNIDFSEENFVSQELSQNTLETYLLQNMDIEDLIIE